jgi:hypothetical protein
MRWKNEGVRVRTESISQHYKYNFLYGPSRCVLWNNNKLESVKHENCVMLKSEQGWLHVSASFEAIIRPFRVEQLIKYNIYR